jgi:hypothetical protein
MLNNFETNNSDNTESQSNDWDMSDVAEFRIPDKSETYEKSEEERNYEAKERALQDELFSLSDRRANIINNAGEECSQILKRAEHPFANRLQNNFDDLTSGKKSTGRATLETFFGYMDAMYPSPYGGKERDPKKVEECEGEYRRFSMREGECVADSVDEIAKSFAADGSDLDLHIAQMLRNVGQDTADFGSYFSRAVIAYAEDPSSENRSRLNRAQSDHEGTVSNSLFNIATTFDDSRTTIGKKLFDPSVELATMITRNSEEYFEGILAYMKFKMGEKTVHVNNSENKVLPDVFLS